MSSPEDLFKNAFDDFSPKPPNSAWQVISKKLRWYNFLKFNPTRFNIYYLAAIMVGAGFIVSNVATSNNQTIAIDTPKQSVAEVTQTKKVQQNNDFSRAEDYKAFAHQQNETIISTQNNEQKNVDINNENIAEKKNTAQTISAIVVSTTPKTDNQEQNQETKKESKIDQTTHQTQKKQKTIVHSKVQTEFPAIFSGEGLDEYDNVSWLFGDGTFASGTKTRHAYKKAGNYQVSMIVKNKNNSDTISKTITVCDPEYTLLFPNALNASPSGSCNGIYNYNSRNAEVFYPRGDYNKIDKYQLTIYNRKGQEIFKTNDITIGWDGYYKGEKQPKGVYVYNAIYTFINGETYTKNGNITLMFRDR